MVTTPPPADSFTTVRASAHALPATVVAEWLGVDPARGLSTQEAARRLSVHGANQLRRPERRGWWVLLLAQLRSIIVALLLVASVLSFVWGHRLEGASVLIVVALNTLIGFVTELQAQRSMEALRLLGDVETTVRRSGVSLRVPARTLVVGDVVLAEAGDRVTADARLVVASRLAADESSLTGESVPVEKNTMVVAGDAPLAERHDMLLKGTALTRGAGEAIVVATGNQTALGQTASLVEEVEDVETPLEKRLIRLGRQLMWVSLGFAVVIAASGILAGHDPQLVVETAIALAVATVPEGLPIVATLALARGMWRMANRNALVAQLSAVETLGSASVLITDKTGTLTDNRMAVSQIVVAEGGAVEALERAVLEAGTLCNDATLPGNDATPTDVGAMTGSLSPTRNASALLGDPMEVALLLAARSASIERDALLRRLPEVRQDAFDPDLKMMATVHRSGAEALYAVKGAPEAVLPRCQSVATAAGRVPLDDAHRAHFTEQSNQLGRSGKRILAVATKTRSSPKEDPYQGLTLLGLVGLSDPPRAGVRGTLERCRSAGMRLIMATGDQAATAETVARAVALVEGEPVSISAQALNPVALQSPEGLARVLSADIVARCTPRDKLTLLSVHQNAGQTVAMLGDGINDAPALRQADIGIAMGKRGTQVAREAADMVLLDDELTTVVMAIEQGRIIFDNIRKFVVYLLSCNVSEILVIGLASVAQAPLPLLPLQILFLNLVTDVFPALALAGGEGAAGVMQRPPRPRHEALLTGPHWLSTLGHGGLLTGITLGVFALALGPLAFAPRRAVTVSFLTLGFVQLAHVFNLADDANPFSLNEVTRNRAVWLAVGLCTALLVAAVHAPVLSEVLQCEAPGAVGWWLIAGGSLCSPLTVALLRLLRPERGRVAESGRNAGPNSPSTPHR